MERVKVAIRQATVVYGRPDAPGRPTVACLDVTLDVRDGEFVSIVGPSGCGKTTLLKAIHGLLPVARGSIAIDGRPVNGPTEGAAMVFQSAALLPWRTVEGNVAYGLELMGVPREERLARARRSIERVGLAGFERHLPHQLSGGMQQRVNLARALAMESGLLLMDEPFASLDAQTREFMQWELIKIWQRLRCTTIFVTHDIPEAIYLADRVVVFTARPGRVRTVIDVPFPRPRRLALKRSPEFLALVEQVWAYIEEEAVKQGLVVVPEE